MNDVSSIRLDLFVGIVKKIAYSLADTANSDKH
jgi:hypothetical protein